MTWQLERASGSTRTEFKVLKGVRVERVRRHGLHYTSMTGRNAVGTYARPRWATVHFKCLGQTFTTWGGVVEFLGDAEAVKSAKNEIMQDTPVCLCRNGVPYWHGTFGKWAASALGVDMAIAALKATGEHQVAVNGAVVLKLVAKGGA